MVQFFGALHQKPNLAPMFTTEPTAVSTKQSHAPISSYVAEHSNHIPHILLHRWYTSFMHQHLF